MISLSAGFALGLFGGLHCAGMCGPLLLALPAGGTAGWRLVAGKLAYQVGRIATYCGLGLLLGLAGEGLHIAGWQRWVSIALGAALITGAVFGTRATAGRHLAPFHQRLRRWTSFWIRRRTFRALAVLGMLNGLLPCGLVYVAAAAAMAAGSLAGSVGFMAAFGIGTAPTLLAVSLTGRLIPPATRLRLMRLVPASVAMLGALLILRGMGLGIPMVSPKLETDGTAGSACHSHAVVAESVTHEAGSHAGPL